MLFRFVSTHKVLFQVPENQHTFTEKFPWYGAKVVGLKCHSSRVFKSPLEKMQLNVIPGPEFNAKVKHNAINFRMIVCAFLWHWSRGLVFQNDCFSFALHTTGNF